MIFLLDNYSITNRVMVCAIKKLKINILHASIERQVYDAGLPSVHKNIIIRFVFQSLYQMTLITINLTIFQKVGPRKVGRA